MTEAYHVRAKAPDGALAFVCYDAPGLTPDRAKATAFTNRAAAERAAHRARWGDPGAFWNSERASAAATRTRMAGWTFEVEPA